MNNLGIIFWIGLALILGIVLYLNKGFVADTGALFTGGTTLINGIKPPANANTGTVIYTGGTGTGTVSTS
jgi:hypothetical protein